MKYLRFIVVIAIISILLISCGGHQNTNSISAYDPINGESFSVRVSAKHASFGGVETNFCVKKDIRDFAEYISNKDSSVSVTVFQNKFILIKTQTNCFVIEQKEKHENDKKDYSRYCLFAPYGDFTSSSGTDNYDISAYMYVPYNLISDFDNQYPGRFPDGYKCSIYGTIDDFYDFYNSIADCKVQKDNACMTVTNEKLNCTLKLDFSDDGFVRFFISFP